MSTIVDQNAASAAGTPLDIETLIDRGAWAWRQKRVLLLVGLAILFAYGLDLSRLLVGAVLVLGCFGALIESVRRGARG